jgi:hypothetical protein
LQLGRARSRRATPVGPRKFHSPWADCIGAKLQLLLLAPGRERCEFCSVQVTTVLSLTFYIYVVLIFKWPSNVLKPRVIEFDPIVRQIGSTATARDP